jgi:hypothetical protein
MIAAWASIVMIFYATMTDVGFVYSLYFKLSPFLMQTDMRSFARFEHVIAFACVGAIFQFRVSGPHCFCFLRRSSDGSLS